MVICSAIYSTAVAVVKRMWWAGNVTVAALVTRSFRIASAATAIHAAQLPISAINIQPSASARQMCKVKHAMCAAKAPSIFRLKIQTVVLSASALARLLGTFHICHHHY